jgi:glycosyltransferase involved in cell wall biosynthesis
MIGAPFQTVTCDPGGRIGVPARELVNAFVGRRSRFARSSLPARPGSQRANSRIAWQSAFGHGSLIEGRPSGECRLRLPESRFEFFPLQRGQMPVVREEDISSPYLLAMGSAHRDYQTLISAVQKLGIQTLIVTRPDIAASLPKPANVKFLSDLSHLECLKLLARARLSVTPINNLSTASGQVTFVEAMRLGVPVVATRCPGTDGYIDHQKNGVLVEPFDEMDLTNNIDKMWYDSAFRTGIAKAGKITAAERFSDEAAAERLRKLLLEF